MSSVTFLMAADCNLRCVYCYQNAKNPRRASWRILRPWLDRAMAAPDSAADILFTGGEPLLEFPLLRRAVRYIEQRRPPRFQIQFHLLTNGTLVGRREIEFLAAHDFEVQVSLDGTPAAQRLRGQATVARLDRLLGRLEREHPKWFARRVSVGVTLLASTIPTLSDSVEYLLSKRVARIAINPALTHQTGWNAEVRPELERQFRRVCRLTAARYRETGETPVVLFRHKPRRPAQGRSGWLCEPFRGDDVTVDVDGEVSGCVMFARSSQQFPRTVLGRALSTLQLGAADSPAFTSRQANYRRAFEATGLFDRAEDKFSSYGRCGSCRYGQECNICPVAIAYQSPDDPNRVPDFLCAFNQVTVKTHRRYRSITRSARASRRRHTA